MPPPQRPGKEKINRVYKKPPLHYARGVVERQVLSHAMDSGEDLKSIAKTLIKQIQDALKYNQISICDFISDYRWVLWEAGCEEDATALDSKLQSGYTKLYADDYDSTLQKLKLLTQAFDSIPNASTSHAPSVMKEKSADATPQQSAKRKRDSEDEDKGRTTIFHIPQGDLKFALYPERKPLDKQLVLHFDMEIKIYRCLSVDGREYAERFAKDERYGIGPRVRSYLESFKTEHFPTLPDGVHVSVKWNIDGSEVTGEAFQERNGSTLFSSVPEICTLATDTLADFLLAKKEESKGAATQRSAKRHKNDPDCDDAAQIKFLLAQWEDFIQLLIYATNNPGTHGITWKEEELRRILSTYKKWKLDADGNVVREPTPTDDFDDVFENYITLVVNKD